MSKLNFQIFLINDDNSYAQIECEDLGSEFTTSFSTTDITDISSRLDNISKNITIKATKNNNRVLGNLYDFARFSDESLPERLYYNFSPNRGVSCIILEDSVEIFRGILKITEVDSDSMGNYTYLAVVTGSLIGFLGKIGNTLLPDAFVNDIIHTYNLTTITNSWDINFSDGIFEPYHSFFYPQIDYGKGVVPNVSKYDMRNFRTGIYLKGYFDNIFKKYGYTYSGDFVHSDVFLKAFVPYSEQEFSRYITTTLYDAVTTGSTSYTIYTPPSAPNGTDITINTAVDNAYIHKGTRTFTGIDVTTYNLTRNVTTNVNFNTTFTASVLDGTDVSLNFSLFAINTDGSINISDSKSYKFAPSAKTVSDTFSLSLGSSSFSKGQGFAVLANLVGSTVSETCSLTVNSAEFSVGANLIQSQVEIISGDTLNVRELVPQSVMVKDFLKDCLKFFNLYLLENPNVPNDLIIAPFDIFYEKALLPVQYAVDWTKKVDLSSGTKSTYNTQLPSAYNFKFTKDDDNYYNKLYSTKYDTSYGDFSITNSRGLADPLDVEVTFSPTVIVLENGDDKTMPAIYKGKLTAKETYKSNLRILYNNGSTICKPYDLVLTSSGTTAVTYTTLVSGITGYNTSHHVLKVGGVDSFNLLFGLPKEVYAPVGSNIFDLPTIYNDFYENQLIELNDNNVFIIELNVMLTASDISNLDMRTPVFINTKNGGAYFKIISIDYYNSQQASDVKLQKIIL
jgi:hypothetical protein